MPKRAVIYIRVSSEAQAGNFSLPTQRCACEQYAHQRGFEVLATLSDEQSGAQLNRPGINHLRELITKEIVHAVIVYAADRLTRNHAHALFLEDMLRRAGVELHVVAGHNNELAGDTADYLDTTFAEYEHHIFQERVARGRRGKNEAGSITGQGGFAPYGYRMEGKKSATHLVVDSSTAAIVRFIFMTFLNTSVRETSRCLQAMDIPSPVERGGYPKSIYKRRARTEWCDSSIYHILNNQTYVGRWHTYYSKIPVAVPTIIDPAIFAAAQAKLERGRAIHRRSTDRPYLLRRRLRCRDCNYAMIGYHTRGRLYYRCTAANNGKHCSLPHIRTSTLEPYVWEWIAATVLREAHLQAVVAQFDATTETNRIQAEAERVFYEHQRDNLERRMLDLADLYSASVYTLAEVKQKKDELSRVHTAIVAELRHLTQQLDSAALVRTNVDQLLGLIQATREQENEPPSFDVQRRILELLDTRVEMFLQDGIPWAGITCTLTRDTTTIRLAVQQPAS